MMTSETQVSIEDREVLGDFMRRGVKPTIRNWRSSPRVRHYLRLRAAGWPPATARRAS